MATAKMETAAQRYRRESQETEVLHDITCPKCGSEWQTRKADLEFWVASGMIPAHLAAVMLKAVKQHGAKEADIMNHLDLNQMAQSIESTSRIVRYTAVSPRIVEKAEGPNDLEYDEVRTCCYNFLRDWQMKGGDRASLETFRPE